MGYFILLLSGVFFGLFGSGGSVLIIPALIYLFNMPIYDATNYSLVIVLVSSLTGTLKHFTQNNLYVRKSLYCGVPALVLTLITRLCLFPKIPISIECFGVVFSKQFLLMLLFVLILIISSISMIKAHQINIKFNSKLALCLIGALVGTITGLLGIGGGFLMVPALMIFGKMDMRASASSALFIIMLNTLTAIIVELFILNYTFDFSFLIILISVSLLGLMIGIYLLNKIQLHVVKKIFSVCLLLLSMLIVCIELI